MLRIAFLIWTMEICTANLHTNETNHIRPRNFANDV